MLFSKNIAFLAFLYFLQGLPYGLQSRFLPLYFRTHGMSLADIGFFKLLLMPWMLKAIWAPLVDHYGTKKKWLSYSMLGLFMACVLGSFTSPDYMFQLACVLFLFNLLTSTQDIAVDGLAIQILITSELAAGNIAQVVGYKFGAVFSGGLLTWFSEVFNLQWETMFMGLGALYLMAYLVILKRVPATSTYPGEEVTLDVKQGQMVTSENEEEEDEGEEAGNDVSSEKPWILDHFSMMIKSYETKWMLLYVLVYKLGEQGSLTMIPLLLVDRGVSTAAVGFWTGVVGQVISIVGSFLGGWVVSYLSWTPFRVVTLFSKIRLVPLILYVVTLTIWSQTANSDYHGYYVITMVTSMWVMLLGSGIITTTTFTLMMFCSQRELSSIQASHYTTLATIEVLGKLTFSVLIGSFAEVFGYPLTFALFVLLGLLVIAVLKRCPRSLIEMCNTENKHC